MSILWARTILDATIPQLVKGNHPEFMADRWQHACTLYLDALDGWQQDTLTWGAANQATLQLITTIRRAERDGRKTLRVADLAALINQHEEVQ